MTQDVLLNFYLASAKLNALEFALLNLNHTRKQLCMLHGNVENFSHEQGKALTRLLTAAIPSRLRNNRLFRTKYNEEVDVPNLEDSLISAAVRVVSYQPTPHDRQDLRPAQATAHRFLDLLSQTQCLVLNIVDLALASCDRKELLQAEKEQLQQQGEEQQPGSHEADQTNTTEARAEAQQTTSRPLPDEAPPANQVAPRLFRRRLLPTDTVTTVLLSLGQGLPPERVLLPPSSTICLTDELRANLMELDEAAASFELDYVQTLSRRMRTVRQANDLQLTTVLFSEALMWCLAVRLISVQQLADRNPSLLCALPRLAIFVGTRLLPNSIIGTNRLAAGRRLPSMFVSFRTDLAYLCRQLNALRVDQLARLAHWLGPRGLPNLISGGGQRQQEAKPVCTTASRGPVSGAVSASPQLAGRIRTGSATGSLSGVGDGSGVGSDHDLSQWQSSWKVNLRGLHLIYKRISTLADRLAGKYPTEMRFILKAVIEMHDTSNETAALAYADGDFSEPDQQNEDDDQDKTVAEETERELDPHCAIADKSFSSLSRLLDWTEVASLIGAPVGKPVNSGKLSSPSAVVGMVSECPDSSDLAKVLQSSAFLLGGADAGGVVLSDKCSTTARLGRVGLAESVRVPVGSSDDPERGVDVAATCCDESPGQLEEFSAAGGDDDCGGHLAVDSASSKQQPLTSLFATFARVSYCTVSPTDQALHYLPAWQPDRLSSCANVDVDNEAAGLLYEASDEDEESDDELDSDGSESQRTAAAYVVGRQCAACLRSFTLIRRRHHCRRCGHIFCGSCANHWQPVDGLLTNKPQRVCLDCHEFLSPESG